MSGAAVRPARGDVVSERLTRRGQVGAFRPEREPNHTFGSAFIHHEPTVRLGQAAQCRDLVGIATALSDFVDGVGGGEAGDEGGGDIGTMGFDDDVTLGQSG